jgi:hypothetical protein
MADPAPSGSLHRQKSNHTLQWHSPPAIIKLISSKGATMLSFLFRLIKTYHREHGFLPNVLYINDFHYQKLRDSLPDLAQHEAITAFLKMEIVISPEAVHPSVAWVNSRHKPFAACG